MPIEAEVKDTSGQAGRMGLLRLGLVLALVVLVSGLAYRQVTERAAEASARERRQSLRQVMEAAPRGVIVDRAHRVLVGNRERVAAVVPLGELRDEFRAAGGGPVGRAAVLEHHLARLAAVVGRPVALDSVRLERAYARERTVSFVLLDELGPEEIARVEEASAELAPIRLQRGVERNYPHGPLAAHVLGRLRRELVRPRSGPDFATLPYLEATGDFGLEKQFDERLRGKPGEAILRLDALGFPAGDSLTRREPAPGTDVVSTLDLDVQRAAEQALAAVRATRGTAVALAVQTGEVLALASRPGFDLREVSPDLSAAAKAQVDASGAWLNRATQGLYPPGSAFKPFTILAALRSGALRPGDAKHCPGFLEVGGHRFVCHNPAGHGDVTLIRALAQSCNVFAYEAGLAAGPDAVAAEARRFHFDAPTGIDLPGETRRMLVADPAWKQREESASWTTGDTVNLAIGQGYLRVSPLQMACAVASLARRETLTVPTLLRSPGRKPSGDRAAEPLGLGEADYAAVVAGMRAVVEIGIGRDAQVPGVSIAGKSGTAQVVRPEGMMNVAWFVAFAPVERPEIAVAVAIEGDQPGEEFAGAEHAAPVAREIIAAYFRK
jgi:penicillin-binding protein 2